MSKVLVMNGHPATQSLNRLLADTYEKAAGQAGFHVQRLDISELVFDPDFGRSGYNDIKPLEKDLETALRAIEWAETIVLTTPMWWGGVPAKLKGLFDRILIPGRAFDPRTRNELGMPRPLLTSKKARVIMTSDTPPEYLSSYYGDAVVNQLTGQVFNFVGIDPVSFTHFSGASGADDGLIQKWVSEVEGLAQAAA